MYWVAMRCWDCEGWSQGSWVQFPMAADFSLPSPSPQNNKLVTIIGTLFKAIGIQPVSWRSKPLYKKYGFRRVLRACRIFLYSWWKERDLEGDKNVPGHSGQLSMNIHTNVWSSNLIGSFKIILSTWPPAYHFLIMMAFYDTDFGLGFIL